MKHIFSVPGWLLRHALMVLPLISAVMLYAGTVEYGFVWDDLALTNTPVYQTFSLSRVLLAPANGIEYLPVRDLTLMLDHWVYGSWPGGFHRTNLLIFMVATVLVYLLYLRLFTEELRSWNAAGIAWLACLSTLVFTVHPLQVESVAFVTCRNALLALCFSLGAMLAYARYLDSGSRHNYYLSILLVVLALFSKATAVFLPLFLVLQHMYLRKSDSLKDSIMEVVPHLVVTVAAFFMHLYFAHQSGAIGSGASLGSTIARLTNLVAIPEFYAYKFLWPVNLSIDYQDQNLFRIGPVKAVIGSVVALGFFYVVKSGARKRSLVWFLGLAYLVILLPVMNLLPTTPMVADRYVQIGMVALTPMFLIPVLKRMRMIFQGLAILPVVVVLGWLSMQRVEVWQDNFTLFGATLVTDPGSIKSMRNLSYAHWLEGREKMALELAAQAAELDPDDFTYEMLLGWRAQKLGNLNEARNYLEAATQRQGDGIHVAHLKLAEVYYQMKEYELARTALRRSLHLARSTPQEVHNRQEILRLLDHLETLLPGELPEQ